MPRTIENRITESVEKEVVKRIINRNKKSQHEQKFG